MVIINEMPRTLSRHLGIRSKQTVHAHHRVNAQEICLYACSTLSLLFGAQHGDLAAHVNHIPTRNEGYLLELLQLR